MTLPPVQPAVEWRVTPGRVALGMLVGSMLGGTLMVLFGELFRRAYTPDLLAVWIGVSVLWLVAIAVPGGLAWALFHRWRRRGWRSALLVGALGPGVLGLAGFLWFAWREGRIGVTAVAAAVMLALIIAAIGAAVSLTIWRIAYRRGPSSDVAAVFA